MRLFLIGALVMGASFPVAAQQIYKCRQPNGSFVYQQGACSGQATTAAVRSYRAEASRPSPSYAPRQSANYRQASYAPNYPQPQSASIADPNAGIVRNQQRYLTWDEQETARRQQRRADRSNRTDQVTQTGPTTVTDQYGNRYQQPQGSAFVTDERTGKQCFKYGAFIECH